MTRHPRRVWVVGVGVVTAFGSGLAPLTEALEHNRTAARPPLPSHAPKPSVPCLAEYQGTLPECPPFRDDRKVELLFEAFRQLAGLPEALGGRLGVFLGTGLSSVTPGELAHDLYPHLLGRSFDRRSLARHLSTEGGAPNRHLPGRAARALATRLHATGPVQTCFSACAASGQSIADAAMAIRRGEIGAALAGGHDSMTHPLGVASFFLLNTLSSKLCRPFDTRRDGFLLGEGAALLLLANPGAARAAGLEPLAVLWGAGSSADAHSATAPHPRGHGAFLAMERALDDAGIPPHAVEQVNAHGTGTVVGDRAEALAISRLLPESTSVCSMKGAFGHTIAAAGVVELAATIGAMCMGFSPGTAGCLEPASDCPINVQQEPLPRAPAVVLSNSFGFGGQNVSLVLAHPLA